MSAIPPKPHADSRLQQQKLPHFYPEHGSLPVALTLVVFTILLLPMGVVIIVTSDKVTELDYRYDNINNYEFSVGAGGVNPVQFTFNGSTYSMGATARVTFTLSKSISAPVYVQYRLRNYFQNYRWFGASKDSSQLHGGSAGLISDCKPYRYPGEARDERVPGYYNPCGAVPWSLFNDSISLYKASGDLICDGGAFLADGDSTNPKNKCRKTGIALQSDVDKRFKPPVESKGETGPMWAAGGDPSSSDPFLKDGYYSQEPGHKIPSSTDEDFIVWANAAYTGDFNNGYRIIEEDLPAGDYYFDIVETYDVRSMGGEKHVMLITRSWIGGRNHHLGILMTVVGAVSFVIAVAIVILRLTALSTPMYV